MLRQDIKLKLIKNVITVHQDKFCKDDMFLLMVDKPKIT